MQFSEALKKTPQTQILEMLKKPTLISSIWSIFFSAISDNLAIGNICDLREFLVLVKILNRSMKRHNWAFDVVCIHF